LPARPKPTGEGGNEIPIDFRASRGRNQTVAEFRANKVGAPPI